MLLACSEQNPKKLLLTPNEIERINNLKSFDELFDITELKLNIEEINLPVMSSTPTADVNGNIYLICERKEIYKFDKFGNYVNHLSRVGRGPGEYIYINRIYVDSLENVYIDDPGNLQILIYDKNFEFKNKIERETAFPFDKLLLYKKNYLIGLAASNREYPLFLYDVHKLVLEEKFGTPSKDMRKLGIYIGLEENLDISDNNIYYVYAEQYQIFRAMNYETTELLDFVPSYFTSPKKKLNSMSELKGRKFPICTYFFAEDNLLFLGIKKSVFDRSKGYYFDIFSKDGELIKSELPFNMDSPIRKYAPKKYISYNLTEGENDYSITIILMEYKY